jgi:hypothetical protein
MEFEQAARRRDVALKSYKQLCGELESLATGPCPSFSAALALTAIHWLREAEGYAADWIERAQRLAPDRPEVRLLAGDLAVLRDRRGSALEFYHRAADLSSEGSPRVSERLRLLKGGE